MLYFSIIPRVWGFENVPLTFLAVFCAEKLLHWKESCATQAPTSAARLKGELAEKIVGSRG